MQPSGGTSSHPTENGHVDDRVSQPDDRKPLIVGHQVSNTLTFFHEPLVDAARGGQLGRQRLNRALELMTIGQPESKVSAFLDKPLVDVTRGAQLG